MPTDAPDYIQNIIINNKILYENVLEKLIYKFPEKPKNILELDTLLGIQ